MLVAESLLVLLLGEDAGSVRRRVKVPEAIAAGLVADLALTGLVEHDAGSGSFRSLDGAQPPFDPLLAQAWEVVRPKPLPVSLVMGRLARQVAPVVEERVARFTGRVADVAAPVRSVLLDEQQPDPSTGALITLLSALEQTERVLDHPDMSSSAVASRARVVAASAWGGPMLAGTVRTAAGFAVSPPFSGAIDRIVGGERG